VSAVGQSSQRSLDNPGPPGDSAAVARRARGDKLCATVERGEGRVMRCLEDNEASLSASCKKVWEQGKAKHKAASK
jgi:hypothetical protein